jgi:hypothetical protein
MTCKRLLIGLGCVVVLGVAATLHWYRGHLPIAYHNECIRSAIEAAVRIELSSIPQPQHHVTVTNREEIVALLSHLKLPSSMTASRVAHMCRGHLRIKIIMPARADYNVQYDHGIGIYPIDAGRDSPGFCDLPRTSCDYLNDCFAKLGYDKIELGIHEGRTNH